jgi:hypothetical protein
VSVTDKDLGLKALFGRLKGAKGLVLTVGVHGPEGAAPHEDPGGGSGKRSVLEIGIVHEYGLGDNPERSFIRAWADENESQNNETLIKIGQAVVQGQFTAEQGLDRAGLRFVAEIQRRIKGGISPPLDPRTIARKGSSTPLVNTGQLWSSIRHKVRKESDGDE